MQNKSKNNVSILKLTLFVVLFAAAGYFREYFFVQINNILYMKYYNTDSTLAVGNIMKVFERMNYATLYYLKYPFTVIWTAAFFFLNLSCIKYLSAYRSKNFKSLLVFYAIMLGIAGLSMAFSFFVNGTWETDEYTLSRWLFGVAQSPIPALILLAAATLREKVQATG